MGPGGSDEVRPLQFCLRFSAVEVTELRAAARRMDRTLASFARVAIRDYLKRLRSEREDVSGG